VIVDVIDDLDDLTFKRRAQDGIDFVGGCEDLRKFVPALHHHAVSVQLATDSGKGIRVGRAPLHGYVRGSFLIALRLADQ
jgi:hypothetical protein